MARSGHAGNLPRARSGHDLHGLGHGAAFVGVASGWRELGQGQPAAKLGDSGVLHLPPIESPCSAIEHIRRGLAFHAVGQARPRLLLRVGCHGVRSFCIAGRRSCGLDKRCPTSFPAPVRPVAAFLLARRVRGAETNAAALSARARCVQKIRGMVWLARAVIWRTERIVRLHREGRRGRSTARGRAETWGTGWLRPRWQGRRLRDGRGRGFRGVGRFRSTGFR